MREPKSILAAMRADSIPEGECGLWFIKKVHVPKDSITAVKQVLTLSIDAVKSKSMPKQAKPSTFKQEQAQHREELRAKIFEAMKAGKFQKEIAAELGISKQRVNQLMPRKEFFALLATEKK